MLIESARPSTTCNLNRGGSHTKSLSNNVLYIHAITHFASQPMPPHISHRNPRRTFLSRTMPSHISNANRAVTHAISFASWWVPLVILLVWVLAGLVGCWLNWWTGTLNAKLFCTWRTDNMNFFGIADDTGPTVDRIPANVNNVVRKEHGMTKNKSFADPVNTKMAVPSLRLTNQWA